MFNIRRGQMGVGEHSLHEAQSLLRRVDEQCEQGAEPPSNVKLKFLITDFFNHIYKI